MSYFDIYEEIGVYYFNEYYKISRYLNKLFRDKKIATSIKINCDQYNNYSFSLLILNSNSCHYFTNNLNQFIELYNKIIKKRFLILSSILFELTQIMRD